MATLKHIKNRLKSVESTHKLTSAMKLIASARLKNITNLVYSIKNYESSLLSVVSKVLVNFEEEELQEYRNRLPWFFSRIENKKPHAFLIFGANRGLCGNYNLSVIREALSQADNIKKQYGRKCVFLPVTVKTTEYFLKNWKKNTVVIPGLVHFGKGNDSFLAIAKHIIERALRAFEMENLGSVSIVGGDFVNALVQRVKCYSLFPVDFDELLKDRNRSYFSSSVLEPSKIEVLEGLMYHLVTLNLYKAFIESETCEQAARVVTMEGASHNAQELSEKLTLQYNRTRQANITNELIEIIAGTNALDLD